MLDDGLLQRALAVALDQGAEFAEIFVEDRHSRSLASEDGRVDQVISGGQCGAGIRIRRNGATAFAFTEELHDASLLQAVRTAAGAVSLQPEGKTISVNLNPRPVSQSVTNPSPVDTDPRTIPIEDKVAFLERMDRAAHSADPMISQVTAVYFESHHHIKIANSYGFIAEDERCRVRLRAQAIASRGEVSHQGFGSWGPGKTGGYEQFDAMPSPEEIATEAARQAIVLLEAGPAPSGRLPLVVTNGVGGILVHEACGHGLEGDVVSRSGSVYSGRLGQRVAPSCVTVVDDGSMTGEWGSGTFDDEGHPCRRNVLIDEGHLASFMHDATTADREGVNPTGNGRRASFRHLPMPRMTNTYVAPGSYHPEEIIGATDYGIYARSFGGGVADMATGMFSFTVREGYVIRNGRIEHPVTGVTIVGNGPEVLEQVDMVGNDLALAPVICGKDGQKAMVCVGQPTLRIREVTIGGSSKEDE